MTVTIILIVVISGISLYAWNNPDKYMLFMFHPYSVKYRGQYFRFVTSGFIHKDYGHLIFNMITLFFFGRYVEMWLSYRYGGTEGAIYYVLLFILGVIISDLPTFGKYKDSDHYYSLGASGGVSSILFASIMFVPSASVCLYFALCIPGFIFGPLYLLYSYYQGKRMADNINHDAHLYGALFGVLFSIILEPRVLGNFVDVISNYQLPF